MLQRALAVRRLAARRRAAFDAAVTCRRQSSMVVSIAQLACRREEWKSVCGCGCGWGWGGGGAEEEAPWRKDCLAARADMRRRQLCKTVS